MRGSATGIVVAVAVALVVVVVLVLGGARGGAGGAPGSSGGAVGGGGTVGDGPNQVLTGPDRDVPCVEPAGATPVCATPLPVLTPEELATGVPLRLGTLTVPLDHVGPYRVALGQATLARGTIQRMDLGLANAADGDFVAPAFWLELEDATTGAILPTNIYAKGMTPGPQLVNVYLRFDLTSFAPGAVVELAGVAVE